MMFPNLTPAQINRVNNEVNNVENNEIQSLNPEEKTNKKMSVLGKVLIFSSSSLVAVYLSASAYNVHQMTVFGASIIPLISYELISLMTGKKHKADKWLLKFGTNITFTNYEKYSLRPTAFIGVTRSYHFSNKFSINWEIFFKSRAFLLREQRVCVTDYELLEIGYYNIDVSNRYIEFSLMPEIKLFDFSKSNINISFGPFLSAPFRNEPRLDFIYSEDSLYCPDDVDFKYRLAEPGTTKVFAGISFGVEYELGNKIVQIKYCKALNSTNQIYAMNDKSLLNTLDLMIGFKF